ncbi:MAG: hypothetical protein ACKKMS_03145 [Candidatus Nealsonbacteria bacterium]
MRIFELHFNPEAKEDLIFDSFCYEPENIYEKRLGSLYMVGELRNTLPQNSRLLDNIAQVIKGRYYALPLQTPEQSFKEGLKKINEFLAGEVSKENVSWLGNLNFAVLSLKNFDLNFTKVGDIKILLLRAGKIIDIGKNLDLQDIEPYPLKIFINIVSGKLDVNDKILVLTKEVFTVFAEALAEGGKTRQKANKGEELFSSESLLTKFVKEPSFDEKKLREILKAKEKRLSEISGVCLFIDLSEVLAEGHLEKPKIVTFQKEVEKFSIREALSPLIRLLVKVGLILKKLLSSIATLIAKKLKKKLSGLVYKVKNVFHLLQLKFKLKTKKIKIPHLQLPTTSNLKAKIKITENLKKGLISVLVLALVLLIGFFIFQKEEKQQLKKQRAVLNEVQEKINQAENFLIFKEEEKANILFKESWQEILPLTTKEGKLKNEATSLKESIEEHLKNLNKLEKITDPKLIFEFNSEDLIPQKMVISQQDLYFFSPYSQNLFKINERSEGSLIQTDQKFNLAASLDDAILFFSKPDKIATFKNGQFGESLSLKQPYPEGEEDKSSSLPFAAARVFDFSDFSSFRINLYFLDSEKGEIIKYTAPLEEGKDSPQFWLSSETKKATDSKSIAVDGSIWILKENNTISRYYGGQHQKDLSLDFFPYPKKLYKIIALPNLPYLYILEPIQNRIIVLDKTGKIIKQFQSEKFDNLKDFAVSDNGKIIYLLNGLKVYQINF